MYCGIVNITWKADDGQKEYASGLRVSKIQDVTIRTHGTRSFATTNVTGTIVDANVASHGYLNSSMDFDHSVTHTISKGN